jgi:hypothetical protein
MGRPSSPAFRMFFISFQRSVISTSLPTETFFTVCKEVPAI